MLVHSPQTAFHRKIIYNFVWIYLGSSHPEAFCKKVLLEYCKTHRKTPVSESHFLNFIQKETLVQVFFCGFCKTFKESYSYRTLPVDASVCAKIA